MWNCEIPFFSWRILLTYSHHLEIVGPSTPPAIWSRASQGAGTVLNYSLTFSRYLVKLLLCYLFTINLHRVYIQFIINVYWFCWFFHPVISFFPHFINNIHCIHTELITMIGLYILNYSLICIIHSFIYNTLVLIPSIYQFITLTLLNLGRPLM